MNALHLLEALGDGSPKIADTLESLGIKGRVGSPNDCPIARYLRSKGFTCASVSSRKIEARADRGWHDMVTPEPVRQFLFEFDRGLFPTLQDPTNVS